MIEEIKKIFYRSDIDESIEFDTLEKAEKFEANNVKIIILFVDIKRNKDIMLAEMKSLGWSELFSDETVYQGFRVVAISFLPISENK
jgi:hypothetical protein